MPNPNNAGDRAKAYRLRKLVKAGKRLPDVDALWLGEYEDRSKKHQDAQEKKRQSFGASRAKRGRKIHLDVEEHEEQESVGTGAAAAAAAALSTREEGRRIDAMMHEVLDSMTVLKEACAVYRDVCLSLKERTQVLEENHVAMLEAVRVSHLAQTDLEGELRRILTEKDDDPSTSLLMQLIAKHIGFDPQSMPRLGGAASAIDSAAASCCTSRRSRARTETIDLRTSSFASRALMSPRRAGTTG